MLVPKGKAENHNSMLFKIDNDVKLAQDPSKNHHQFITAFIDNVTSIV